MENVISHYTLIDATIGQECELYQIIHCQTQLTIFKFIQIKIWFSNNSSVLARIITSITKLLYTNNHIFLSFNLCS
jgi:hypothetical protein